MKVHGATRLAGGDVLVSSSVTYGPRGKVTIDESSAIGYDDLGHVVSSNRNNDHFLVDPFGNQRTSRTGAARERVDRRYRYEPGSGRLRSHADPMTQAPDYDSTLVYTAVTGELYEQVRELGRNIQLGPVRVRTDESMRYDGALRMTSHTYASDTTSLERDTVYTRLETYRYDALGRRVWVRTERGANCRSAPVEVTSGCVSPLTRVVWNGDQILAEIRTDGRTGQLAGTLENDNPALGPLFGRVLYVHGLDLDQPLSLSKGSTHVTPLGNWKGEIVAGGCPSVRCTDAQVRFPQRGLYGPIFATAPPGWYGSLIESQRDGSGLLYRRHRYLDPATGRFTQEDPIGLAGGLNLYGFADGDPVNYSDPFGLCAHPVALIICVARAARTGFVLWRASEAIGRLGAQAELGRSGVLRMNPTVVMASKPSSAGKMQKEVERDQAPGGVDRVDPGNPSDPGDEQPHIHFKGEKDALRRDGTWKHGEGRPLTKDERRWVEKHNWIVPNQ